MELATKNETELVMEATATESERKEREVDEADVSAKTEELSPVDLALLGRLLEMANAYRSEGNLRQATVLYWALAEDYPGTPQSKTARVVLLELAAGYERNGARHMARSMYERLLGQEV